MDKAQADRPTILLVEDDFDISEAVCDVLEDFGYPVVVAHDGREALGWLQQAAQPPGLILLDLMMPGMNGVQFRAEQLRDAQLARIPVVVLSADRLASERAEDLGVIGCLLKPLGTDELIEAVKRHSGPPARAVG